MLGQPSKPKRKKPIKWKAANLRESTRQVEDRPPVDGKRRKSSENPYLYTGPDTQRRIAQIEANAETQRRLAELSSRGVDVNAEERLEDSLRLPEAGVLPTRAELQPYFPTAEELEAATVDVCDVVKDDLRLSIALHEAIRRWALINRSDDLNFGDSADTEQTLLQYGARLSKLSKLEKLLRVYGLSPEVSKLIMEHEVARMFPPPMPHLKTKNVRSPVQPISVDLGEHLLSGL